MVGTASGLVLGCSGDTTNPRSLSMAQTYYALQLNIHAVNMATVASHNTIQLTATPVNPAGDTLAGLGTVTYTAHDSNVVVSATGLVTARYRTQAGNPTYVVATLTDPSLQVTNADTVYIQVTDTIPHHGLQTFSIHPLSGDSAKRSLNFTFNDPQWPVFATDSANNPVCTATLNADASYSPTCALVVYFTTSDPTVATLNRNTGQLNFLRPGHVTFYATTTAYGQTVRDSLPFVVGWPSVGYVNITWVTPLKSLTPVATFIPSTIIVTAGATVGWQNGTYYALPPDSVDVTFDDSTAVQPGCGVFSTAAVCDLVPPGNGGNIPLMFPDTAAVTDYGNTGNFQDVIAVYSSSDQGRTFPRVGTYKYHSRRYPTATGEILVRTDP
jgi:hypothetical protein